MGMGMIRWEWEGNGNKNRMTSVKILGVTITHKLSVSDHVCHVIASMLHALRVNCVVMA